MQNILGVLSVILGLSGYVFYIRGIVQGKVKPHAFSWFVWGLLTAIAFVAQITQGGGPGAWVTGVTALCSFFFTIVGLTKSSRVYIAKSDWIFFIGAVITIPIWYLTGNPLWSVIIVTLIDTAASIPTFRKAFHNPETENVWTCILAGVKFLISLFALQSFTWITALYPASLILTNFALAILLVARKGKGRH